MPHTAPPVHLCGREIGRPGHICAFFNSRETEYSTLIPFFKDGLGAGEEVFTVVDEDRIDDHKRRLHNGGIPARAGMSTSSSEDTYLLGGKFDMERMASFIESVLISSRGRGARVRTAGWMDWLDGHMSDATRVMEYEARMNYLVPAYDCTFLCVYDINKMPGRMVVDVMATHPWVILNGEIRENSFYIPPDQYIKQLLARETQESRRSA